jgi:hypothetical protein
MKADVSHTTRCGIDTVEIGRMERLIKSSDDLKNFFTPHELQDAGDEPGGALRCQRSVLETFSARDGSWRDRAG